MKTGFRQGAGRDKVAPLPAAPPPPGPPLDLSPFPRPRSFLFCRRTRAFGSGRRSLAALSTSHHLCKRKKGAPLKKKHAPQFEGGGEGGGRSSPARTPRPGRRPAVVLSLASAAVLLLLLAQLMLRPRDRGAGIAPASASMDPRAKHPPLHTPARPVAAAAAARPSRSPPHQKGGPRSPPQSHISPPTPRGVLSPHTRTQAFYPDTRARAPSLEKSPTPPQTLSAPALALSRAPTRLPPAPRAHNDRRARRPGGPPAASGGGASGARAGGGGARRARPWRARSSGGSPCRLLCSCRCSSSSRGRPRGPRPRGAQRRGRRPAHARPARRGHLLHLCGRAARRPAADFRAPARVARRAARARAAHVCRRHHPRPGAGAFFCVFLFVSGRARA